MLSFTMKNINTLDEVSYIIYDGYIEVTTNTGITRMNKPNKNNNQIAMDLINNLINQGCIISEFNLIR